MSNLRNRFSRKEISLINRRSHQLATTITLLYQQALMRAAAELKDQGLAINAETIGAMLPAISDDLAAFEQAEGK